MAIGFLLAPIRLRRARRCKDSRGRVAHPPIAEALIDRSRQDPASYLAPAPFHDAPLPKGRGASEPGKRSWAPHSPNPLSPSPPPARRGEKGLSRVCFRVFLPL